MAVALSLLVLLAAASGSTATATAAEFQQHPGHLHSSRLVESAEQAHSGQPEATLQRARPGSYRRLLATNPTHKPKSACTATGTLTLSWMIQMDVQYGSVFTVPCGASIRFEWPGEPHGVVRLQSLRCPNFPVKTYQKQMDAFRIAGGAVRNSGKAVIRPKTPGEIYFSCQIYGHCQTGQLIRVNVIPSNQYKGGLLKRTVKAKKGCKQNTASWAC